MNALRIWSLLHKWTSLIATAFVLMLSLTGLPLIFHHEIDAWGAPAEASAPSPKPRVSLDTVVRRALAARPGEVALFVSWDEDRPVVNVTTAPTQDADEEAMTLRSYDLRTGALADTQAEASEVMEWLLELHTDMFLGPAGSWLLAVVGLVFLVAVMSGVVLYAPFVRGRRFGSVRTSGGRQARWLDLHNLFGIVTLAWMAVVGATGVINTLEGPIVDRWRATEVADMTRAYAGQPPVDPRRLASLQAAVDAARAAAPNMRPQFVAFPGGAFSSPHHYAVFLQGDTPLTKSLLTPALVDAETGVVTGVRPMPLSVKALFVSRPLHFGDYGGLPMKLLWAALTLMTIVVLGSGLFLWAARHRRAR